MKKKLTYFNRRGAVSIFLVIVLVPMITCSSLFVDASRVKSATGMVSSAGDLTLNTVLSQYDVDLNDFYGLMASAQDMDDVLGAAEDYFTSCIKSQDIDTTSAAKWANSIKNIFIEDGDISDLLGVDLAPDTNVSVTPTKDGSLTNPALVKTQVVEFMKYRSPINSIVKLYERFKNSSKELENTTKTSDLVEKKQDYYEAQGKVAKKAYEVYENIVKYDQLGITQSDLQELKTFMESLDGRYKSYHTTMVKDLYNTQGLFDEFEHIEYCVTIPSQYSHDSRYDNSSAQKIGGLINKLMRAYDQFITARESFDENIKAWSTSGNSYYDIQYWAYCCKNYSYFSNVHDKEVNMKNSYINLLDAVDHAADGAMNEVYTSTYNSTHLNGVVSGTQKTIQSWWDWLKSLTNDAARSVTQSGSKYNTSVNAVRNVSNLYDRISTSDTNTGLADTYNTLNDYYTRYNEAFGLLTKIVNGLGELKKLVVTADNKFSTWESKADSYSSDIELARSDQHEIQEVRNSYKKLKESDIQDYIDHINNVKAAIGTVKEGAKKVKYNGQSIIDKNINGYESFKNYSSVLENDIPLYIADLENYVNETYDFSMEGIEISALNYTANNDPKIADKRFAVYKWMIDQGFDTPKDENREDEYNNKKKEADDQANGANDDVIADVASKNDISTLEGLPSGTSADLDSAKISSKIKDVSNFAKGLFSNFGSTMAQAGVDIRDDLFAVDYITSMLTWQTFEYEAKYNMLSKSDQKDISYSNAQSYYSGKNDAWKSTDVTQKYNKTLTNKLRNSESTNWSYCNEVEYVMYGKNIKDSKSAINSTIFMIRFALNVPTIFSTYYSDSELVEFAGLVNLATHGIVPAGLVKVIICLGLTALESAQDLKTLKCGIPVILFKTKQDDLFVENWMFMTRATHNPVTDKTSAITFSYSDYMKLILFLKLLGSESYNVYGRLSDVLQTNMSKCVLKDDSYSFSKSQVYYSIDATVKVKPLMLDTSYVLSFMGDASDRMDSWNTITYSTTRGY